MPNRQESYENSYVVDKIDDGRWTIFKIIASRTQLVAMLKQLTESLERPASTADKPDADPLKNQLFSEYATLANIRTDRTT